MSEVKQSLAEDVRVVEVPELPAVIPVFPLTGALLLPGNWLPLHVFEPRYRAMVEDAVAGAGVIGMIQPLLPSPDDHPDPSAAPDTPVLYQVGCAGRIKDCEPLSGGRYAIALVGLSRFRVLAEVAEVRGYRRVEAEYRDFVRDLEAPAVIQPPAGLLRSLLRFGERHQFSFDLERLGELPADKLINGLAMALPFGPAEKQALLEADLEERAKALEALLEMGVDTDDREDPSPPLAN
jgi:Lon protease-like protein